MTQRSQLNTLSNEEQRLSTVWEWYGFQRALIREEKSRLFGALARGESPAASRYVGKTREKLDADLAFQDDELSRLSMFGMFACTEAALRVDFIKRVGTREKDDVSRGFRDAFKEQGGKFRLEEDILDVWREHGEARIKGAVQRFKDALNLRHWLAHGRYWKPKLGRVAGYDAVDVFDICSKLLLVIGLTP